MSGAPGRIPPPKANPAYPGGGAALLAASASNSDTRPRPARLTT